MLHNVSNKLKLLVSNLGFAIQSIFWKKDKSVILFGAWFGEKFADNSRCLFQYLDAHKKELHLDRVIWVTHSPVICTMLQGMGYESYIIGTPEATVAHKRAGYHIVCNAPTGGEYFKGEIDGRLSYGAIRVNLWHGVGGIKGCGCSSLEYKKRKSLHPCTYKIKENIVRYSKLFRCMFMLPGGWGDCYYLSTTPAQTNIMQQYTLLPHDRYIESCYPRVLGCERYLDSEKKVLSEMKKHQYTILYLPTFRGENSVYDFKNLADSMKDLLLEKDILWIEKAHSAAKQVITSEGYSNNILRLTSDFDINVLMPEITALVTDYSSAKADAMYFYKPVIFYVPDFDEYCSGDRGFMLDPKKVLCGPQLRTSSEMQDFLGANISHLDALIDDNYLEVRKDCWNDTITTMNQVWKSIVEATK